LNGQVDYDNLKQELVTISVKVDGSGVPTQSTTIGTSKLKSIQGLVVVQVRNSSSASSGLTAAPFIDYIVNSSTNLKVNKIFGLAAGIQYQIKVLLIG
jgi:Flp pilus assembly protein TadG